MDPLSALSFSCNVLDLVERAIKCGKTFKELYESPTGQTAAHQSLDSLVEETRAIVDDLRFTETKVPPSRTAPGERDSSLRLVAAKCQQLAAELEEVVQKCSVRKPGSIASSVKAGIRGYLKKQEIHHLKTELEHCAHSLHTSLATCARRDIAFVTTQLMNAQVQQADIFELLNAVDGRLQVTLRNRPEEDLADRIRKAVEPTEKAMSVVNQHIILSGLKSRGLQERFNDIHTAANETLDWVFDTDRISMEQILDPKSRLSDWLKQGSGVFHVLGKPGAGKSTLMKFICHHPATTGLLREWVGERELVCCRHFFWKLGHRDQKSFHGLTRSLLFWSLNEAPALTEFLFPQHWNPKHFIVQTRFELELTETDLTEAFDRLCSNTADITSRFRFCFFIDGLDEFDQRLQSENEHDLVHKVVQWAENSSDSIKICVSSRELPAFENMATSQTNKIKLHELTQADIALVVTRTLEKYEHFQNLQKRDLDGCNTLIRSIVEDAEGVFLWVQLLLESLGDGLVNEDSLELLQDRVAQTPTELEDFLLLIIESVDKNYQQGVYTLLAVVMRMAGQLLSDEARPPELQAFDAPDVVTKLSERVHNAFSPEAIHHYSSVETGLQSVFPTATDAPAPKQSVLPDIYDSSGGLQPQGLQYISLAGCFFFFRSFDAKTPLDTSEIPLSVADMETYAERARWATIQVKGRCKGLLEVSSDSWVKFIHRSLSDFLSTYLRKNAAKYGINDASVGEAMLWTLYVEMKSLGIARDYGNFEDLLKVVNSKEGPSNSILENYEQVISDDCEIYHWPAQVKEVDQWFRSIYFRVWGDCRIVMARCSYVFSRLRQISLKGNTKTLRLLYSLEMAVWSELVSDDTNPAVSFLSNSTWELFREPWHQEQKYSRSNVSRARRFFFSVSGLACFLGLHEYVGYSIEQFLATTHERLLPPAFGAYLLVNVADGLSAGVCTCGSETLQLLFARQIDALSEIPLYWYKDPPKPREQIWARHLHHLLLGESPDDLSELLVAKRDIPQSHWDAVETWLRHGGSVPLSSVVNKHEFVSSWSSGDSAFAAAFEWVNAEGSTGYRLRAETLAACRERFPFYQIRMHLDRFIRELEPSNKDELLRLLDQPADSERGAISDQSGSHVAQVGCEPGTLAEEQLGAAVFNPVGRDQRDWDTVSDADSVEYSSSCHDPAGIEEETFSVLHQPEYPEYRQPAHYQLGPAEPQSSSYDDSDSSLPNRTRTGRLVRHGLPQLKSLKSRYKVVTVDEQDDSRTDGSKKEQLQDGGGLHSSITPNKHQQLHQSSPGDQSEHKPSPDDSKNKIRRSPWSRSMKALMADFQSAPLRSLFSNDTPRPLKTRRKLTRYIGILQITMLAILLFHLWGRDGSL